MENNTRNQTTTLNNQELECDPYYACITEYRLELANDNKRIQGYNGEYFYKRNTRK